MPELVSVLIPAYNASRWLGAAIESALGQTWGRKEIVVVDDGSNDGTLEIAKSFETRSVKVVSQENRGAAAARNRALGLAGGAYIQWLDADDLLASDKIARQMEAAAAERSKGILYSSPYGVFYYRPRKARFTPNSLWQNLSPLDWLVTSMSEGLWMNPAGWLVSRELTEKAGPWDERLSMDDDGEYFARVVKASEAVRFVREAKCFYRQSGFGQLGRNLTESACRSLVLSTTLRVRNLLALEDGERTRSAALAFMQRRWNVFYPEKTETAAEMKALASELGVTLEPPRLPFRARLLQGLLGPAQGKKVMASGRRLRLRAAIGWDSWMSKIGL